MRIRKSRRRFLQILAVWAFVSGLAAFAAPPRPDPANPAPNEPARADIRDGRIVLSYAGRTIFEGIITTEAKTFETRLPSSRAGDKVEQVIYFYSGGRYPLKLAGTISGSEEAFPCESDRRDRRGAGPTIVRHVSGLSRSLLNRAVYDRRSDWVLSVDSGPAITLLPRDAQGGGKAFTLQAEGGEIVLRFRPRFFRNHRGLSRFEPWTYKPWPGSVAGWISWFAFYDKVSEKDMLETAEVFSEILGPFGYEIFQMDDGYQRGTGSPENWLVPNEKFPGGLKALAGALKAKGLRPGLWTAASVHDKSFAEAHPSWFVRDAKGHPALGNWIGYALDASAPSALEAVVKPLYEGLLEQGWEYFKLDGLRHLRYEGYNANRGYFERKKSDPADILRRYVQAVRDVLGRDKFLLACWGLRPELIGLVDACRIGDDGFAYAGLAQYNSFNNIVWRNDPDHIELDADGWRSTLVTTLTGSLLMLTDKPAVYRTAAVEPAKRTVPVLFTRPGQVYDVDPSRSVLLSRVDAEVTGSGPRPFDGGYTPSCFLYSLEIDRPFENWLVLGRTGGENGEIRMVDLGLDPSRAYTVFEFWSKRFLGSFTGSFLPGALDPRFRSQAFILRERKPHPQLIATSRHVTGGGVDLIDLRWDGTALGGKSRGVKGDPYILYLTEPEGYAFKDLAANGADVERSDRDNGLLRLTLQPAGAAEFTWSVRFAKKGD